MKVIHIMDHPTPYNIFRDMPRPSVNWDISNGDWIGIWGDDWSDRLSIEILKISGEFQHEVWQPEYKTKTILSHEFESGLIHRLFPATRVVNNSLLFLEDDLISPDLVNYLLGIPEYPNKCIIHIGQSVFNGLYKDLLTKCSRVKFVMTFHGEIMTPKDYLFRHQKNYFKKIKHFKDHKIAYQLYSRFSHITYQSQKNLSSLQSYYNGPLTKLTMGLDFGDFKPLNKVEMRDVLNINHDKKVLLSVGLIRGIKQIDKLIEVLKLVNSDFLFVIVGDGEPEYIKELKEKADGLVDSSKIRFEGYKSNSELRSYFYSADLFVHVAKSEAGPVVTMEALACEIPILTTNTGNVAELLLKENVGKVVGITDYKGWKTEIEKFLKGSEIKVMNREIARQYYDWKNVAQKFLDIYREVANHS